MNKYGRLAEEHWREKFPAEYSTLGNAHAHFTALGERIKRDIDELALQIGGPDRVADTQRERILRKRAARRKAEQTVLSELVWMEPGLDDSDAGPSRNTSQMMADWARERSSNTVEPVTNLEVEQVAREWVVPVSFLLELLTVDDPDRHVALHAEMVKVSDEVRSARHAS